MRLPRAIYASCFLVVVVQHVHGEVYTDPVQISIGGLTALRGELVFGADPVWFDDAEVAQEFVLQSFGILDTLSMHDSNGTHYVASDSGGRVYLSDSRDKMADWSYTRLYHGEPAWKCRFIHNVCTSEWHKKDEKQPFLPVTLGPSDQPRIVKDKDGVERNVYPAILVRGGNKKLVVTRLSKAEEYSPSLLAGDRFNIAGGRFRVLDGEVWFGPGDFGEASSSTWHFDGQLVVMRHEGKWKFLTADEKGAVSLFEKPKAGSLWEFTRPKREEGISAFTQELDDGKTLYLAPSDEVTKRKDRTGAEVELRRAVLLKDQHRYRITRFAP